MKKVASIALALLAAACTSPKTIEKDGGLVLEVRFIDPAVGNDVKNHAAEVILNRMNAAFVWNPVTEITADHSGIHIELPLQEDTLLFSELATKPGRFEIVECYPRGDVLPLFMEIDEKMAAMPEYADTENPLLTRYLHLISDPFSDITGVVPSDVAGEFEALMDSDWVKALFPRGAKPALMKPEQDMCSLFVLKYSANGHAPITDEMIETAAVSGDRQIEDNYVVDFRFAKPFHDDWARLTRKNISRNLAIVMDGRIYSAPQVNDEIEDGRCTISGNFTTMEEAGFISAILNSAPCRRRLKSFR